MGLFVLVVVAVMMMARLNRNSGGGRGGSTTTTAAARQGETLFDESSADLAENVGNDSTLTKLFTLSEDARLSLKNVNGNIRECLGRAEAEVKVIGEADRRLPVFFTNTAETLVRTSRSNQEVRFG